MPSCVMVPVLLLVPHVPYMYTCLYLYTCCYGSSYNMELYYPCVYMYMYHLWTGGSNMYMYMHTYVSSSDVAPEFTGLPTWRRPWPWSSNSLSFSATHRGTYAVHLCYKPAILSKLTVWTLHKRVKGNKLHVIQFRFKMKDVSIVSELWYRPYTE